MKQKSLNLNKLIYAHPHKSLFCAALLSASILTLLSSLQSSQVDVHELHTVTAAYLSGRSMYQF